MDRYVPSLDWGTSGDPESWLERDLQKAVDRKAGRNRLREHPNNVVAINMFGADFQASLQRQIELGLPLPEPTLPDDIQLATISVCGIDKALANVGLGFARDASHPAIDLLGLRRFQSAAGKELL